MSWIHGHIVCLFLSKFWRRHHKSLHSFQMIHSLLRLLILDDAIDLFLTVLLDTLLERDQCQHSFQMSQRHDMHVLKKHLSRSRHQERDRLVWSLTVRIPRQYTVLPKRTKNRNSRQDDCSWTVCGSLLWRGVTTAETPYHRQRLWRWRHTVR